MAKEEWKKCYYGYYEVSSRGRVRRRKAARGTRPGRILLPRNGWVALCKGDGFPVEHKVDQLKRRVFR